MHLHIYVLLHTQGHTHVHTCTFTPPLTPYFTRACTQGCTAIRRLCACGCTCSGGRLLWTCMACRWERGPETGANRCQCASIFNASFGALMFIAQMLALLYTTCMFCCVSCLLRRCLRSCTQHVCYVAFHVYCADARALVHNMYVLLRSMFIAQMLALLYITCMFCCVPCLLRRCSRSCTQHVCSVAFHVYCADACALVHNMYVLLLSCLLCRCLSSCTQHVCSVALNARGSAINKVITLESFTLYL